MKYALLVYDVPAEWAGVTEEQMGGLMQEYQAVSQESSGGERLQPVDAAKTVRVKDGASVVTDGPFAETKEHLGGFYLVDADSEQKALELAARIPSARMGGAIEVRPIMEM
jgi:hypothetical protein